MIRIKQILIGLFTLCFTLNLSAESVTNNADKAYREKNFVKAANLYEEQIAQILADKNQSEINSSNVYYNLGNCYFRMNNYGKAVLNYQRALHIDAANEDAEFNLELTQTKLTDHFEAPAEMFFISWFKSLINSRNSDTWGHWGLFFLILTFTSIAIFRFGRKLWLRKTGFLCTIISILLLITCECFAYIQHNRFNNLQLAVVLRPAVNTFDSPNLSAKKQKTIHEGTTVTIIGAYEKQWLEIQLPDGSEVWINTADVERV